MFEHVKSDTDVGGTADSAFAEGDLAAIEKVANELRQKGRRLPLISTMRATSPTTWSAHAFAHFIKTDCYTAVPSFIFLGRYDPADPFIARERCDIRPYSFHFSVRLDCFAKIRWHSMYHTTGELVVSLSNRCLFGHHFLRVTNFNRK